MLREIPLPLVDSPFPEELAAIAREGLRRSKAVWCFDFVPSHPEAVYRALAGLPPGRWCEWGSGAGINTAIAAWLGFHATGIELHPQLAELSRGLLEQFGLTARILTGSYFDLAVPADYYFVYCWPGQMGEVQDRFLAAAPHEAKLLICHGAEDIRCKVRVHPKADTP